MPHIKKIDVVHLTDGLPQLLVRIEDSDGNAGVGECWWGIPDRNDPERGARPIAAAARDLIAPCYEGKDASRIQQLWFECWDFAYRYGDGGIITMALSGIDMALWDLNARRLGISVLDMLGGPAHDAVPAYASFPAFRDPDVLAAETRRAMEHGFTAIKLHELDPAMAGVARDAGGPDLVIMADVNGHFEVAEAIAMGEAFAEHDILWFEEPVRPMRDVNAIEAVASRLDVSIAAGENEYSLADFKRLIDSGAIDYLQPEITKIGGITAAVKVAALAEASRVALCPHNFRLGPALLASMHVGFSSPVTAWFEVPWLPASRHFASRAPMPEIVDGLVEAPAGPGLGYDPNAIP